MVSEAGGELIGGRYRLIEPVGVGGMGRVWRGRDELLDREVAVKEILFPPGMDAAEREVFGKRAMREARSAARLNHPGIVTVHDVITRDGAPVIVMEFVRGPSLQQRITRQGRLAPVEVARIGAMMVEALGEAHAAGIVHRDLKPANVLLTGNRVVITDFGIASLAGDATLTTSGVLMGTPAFMAPEQAHGLPVTAACDLWSLGATLYAAVEGRPPYTGTNLMAILAALLSQDPAPPVHAGPLAPVLAGLLRKDPAERLTADQAAQALTTLTYQPHSAPDVRTRTRTGPPATAFRRRRSRCAAGHRRRRGTDGPGSSQVTSPAPVLPAAAVVRVTAVADRPLPRRRVLLLAGLGALTALGVPTAIRPHPDARSAHPSAGSSPRLIATLTGHTETLCARWPSARTAEPSPPAAKTDTVRLWDVAGRKIIATLTGHTERCHSVAFSPDGKILATGAKTARCGYGTWPAANRPRPSSLWAMVTTGVVTTRMSPPCSRFGGAGSGGVAVPCGDRREELSPWARPGIPRSTSRRVTCCWA